MNKKIKQLADKVWSLDIEPNSHFQLCLQSFAELIVQECAELNRKQSYNIMGVLVDMAEPNAEFDRVCLNTVNHVQAYLSGEALKQHFGVEE